MAVTSFKEIHSGRDGEEATDQRRTIRRYTRVFRVVTNSNSDDAAVIRAHASCPNVGDAHPNDVGSWCRRVNPRNESFSKRVWIVTAAYSSERELSDNPLDDPALITWNTEQFQRPYFQDINGDAIVNSAGDPFDPPAMGDDSRVTATIRKNVAGISGIASWFLSYQDCVNNAPFLLDGIYIAEGAAKMQAVSLGEVQERNSITYRVLSMTMHFRRDAYSAAGSGSGATPSTEWALELLDAGFRELAQAGSTSGSGGAYRRKITDEDGEPVKSPVLLDGSGEPLDDPSASTAVFLPFDIYPVKDFSVLPLA